MILSMTGYGKADVSINNKKIHVEVKSLNSKCMDLSTRISPIYREKEMEIRNLISSKLERGKVDFVLWVEKDAASQVAQINSQAVAAYRTQLMTISQEIGVELPHENFWEVVLRMPEVYSATSTEELSEEEWCEVLRAINVALEELISFRQQEGKALYNKFVHNLERIENLMKEIEPFESSRVEKIRQRLIERLSELKGVDYDKSRLEQELIFYIEKLDINEEKQRLTNHLKYFRETLVSEGSLGKKLGFIAQEMGREINTTGSKSNQAEMQNLVVMMKDELEQIKEQVLNVL